MTEQNKKYGLQIKSAAKKPTVQTFNVFEENQNDSKLTEAITFSGKSAISSQTLRQSRMELEKAYNQDPTVFSYDEVYDKIEKEKDMSDPRKDHSKHPKYVDSLLKSAAFKKREWERRLETKFLKEREDEESDVEEKESFVTDNYRKKLEEREAEDEMLKKQDQIDDKNAPKNQNDMTNFYRNLLNRGLSSASKCSMTLRKESKNTLKGKSNEISTVTANVDDTSTLTPISEDKSVFDCESQSQADIKDLKDSEPNSPKNNSENSTTTSVRSVQDLLEEDLANSLKIYQKRNTKDTIQQAKERYQERKAQNILGHIVAAFAE